MKSRVSVIIAFILFVSGIILAFIAIFVDYTSIWRSLLLLPLIIGTISYILCAMCPHCGKFGLRVRPFAKNCGYCNYCGELVEYDE